MLVTNYNNELPSIPNNLSIQINNLTAIAPGYTPVLHATAQVAATLVEFISKIVCQYWASSWITQYELIYPSNLNVRKYFLIREK